MDNLEETIIFLICNLLNLLNQLIIFNNFNNSFISFVLKHTLQYSFQHMKDNAF